MTNNNTSQPQTSKASTGNDRAKDKNQANLKAAPGNESQKNQNAQKQDKPAQTTKA